jgi:hypothetical protein
MYLLIYLIIILITCPLELGAGETLVPLNQLAPA